MTNSIKITISILTLVLICIAGIVGANYWYKIDVQKCNDISSNDYYYTQNNCWETNNLPWLTMLLMFIILILFPGLIWIMIFIWSLY